MSLGVGGFGFRTPEATVGSRVWCIVSVLFVVSMEYP